ncbi:glycosyltransferase [Salinisphaera sp.]|uniref:glycosyltransferase n=1 Tax=Salinisphaera sp. TaxID=1914330 RepID=UPI002D76F389|nr:glycosyltransferase [Salinisphaera sp.]HET7315121.1 glycosyltransferase [Salinisphaera sp.]
MVVEQAPPVRVAFYLSAFAGGGLERVTLCLMRGLIARGYAVDLVLERKQGDYLARIPASVRVVGLESGGKWRACRRLLRGWPREGLAQAIRMLTPKSRYIPLRRLSSLVDYIERTKPDVMIAAAGRVPFLEIWAARLAKHPVRTVIAEHSTLSARLDAFRRDAHAYRALRYRRHLMRRLYPAADALIAVSRGVAADVAREARLSASRIEVIHNPVVDPADLKNDAPSPDHAWFAPAQTEPVVLAAGRLAPEKDFAMLIEAVASARSRGCALRLMILGEGPERSRLEQRARRLGIADAVALPGWVDEPQGHMAHAAVFALSSRVEGLPVALIEAMACGCPVVATDCPSGPREILEDGRLGRLVPVGDERAMGEALCAALAEPPDRRALQTRAAEFAIEPAIDAYQRLIDRLIWIDLSTTTCD